MFGKNETLDQIMYKYAEYANQYYPKNVFSFLKCTRNLHCQQFPAQNVRVQINL